MYKIIISTLVFISLLSYSQDIDIPYVFLHQRHNDTVIYRGNTDVFSPMVSLDAKSVGMGKTQMIMRDDFNGMWQNPAFLSKKRISFEFTSAQLLVPQNTIRAANYIMNHESSLVTGSIISEISLGLNKIINGQTIDEKKEGVDIYNNAVGFLDELINEFSGPRNEQMIHGLSVFPKFQSQYKNFGFSLYNSTSMAFAIVPGELFRKFAEFQLPSNIDDINQEQIVDLAKQILVSYDNEGNLTPQSLPRIYSVSIIDFIFVAGYGYSISDKFKLGVNWKIVNRRFNTALIDAGNVGYINNNTSLGNYTPFWTSTVDVGGLYIDKQKGLAVSAVFKNIIPTTNDISSTTQSFVSSSISIPTDANGDKYIGRVENNQFIADPNGDTLVYSDIQDIKYINLYTLKTPFLFNLGVNKRLHKDIDLSLDVVDIFMQDDMYGEFYNRIRLGAEYRFFKDIFAARAGLSDIYPTIGFGTNIHVKNLLMQFDFAYAYNNLTKSPGYFVQLKLGYSKMLEDIE